jgi:hypothetical protein
MNRNGRALILSIGCRTVEGRECDPRRNRKKEMLILPRNRLIYNLMPRNPELEQRPEFPEGLN